MKKVLWLLVVGAVAFWLWNQQAGSRKAASTTTSPGAAANASGPGAAGCLAAADRARSELDEAARLLLRPPVDPGAWGAAEAKASSAISSAESGCGPGGTEGEEKVKAEARSALSSMRTFLGELAAASRGQGDGGSLPSRQQEIDGKLEAARGLLRG